MFKTRKRIIGALVAVLLVLFFACVTCVIAGWTTKSSTEGKDDSLPETYTSNYEVFDISEQLNSQEMGLVLLSQKEVGDDEFNTYNSLVLVDPQTKIMYSYIEFTGYNKGTGGLTVMLDQYGKPRIYQPHQ